MIFDDHEIADDWNLNGRWASTGLQPRVGPVRRPQRAARVHAHAGVGQRPGALRHGRQGRARSCSTRCRPSCARRGGADPTSTSCSASTSRRPPTEAGRAQLRDQDRRLQVVVLDTRTHRAINTTTLEAPNLIDNLDEQLPAGRRPPRRSSCSSSSRRCRCSARRDRADRPADRAARDRQHQRPHDRRDARVRRRRRRTTRARAPAAASAASAAARSTTARDGRRTSPGFEAVVARLATLPRVVILSGDVHYASTMTLDYWTKAAPTPARLVQCISSPSKNVFKDVVDQSSARSATSSGPRRCRWSGWPGRTASTRRADPRRRAHLARPPLAAPPEAGARAHVAVAAGLEAARRRRQGARLAVADPDGRSTASPSVATCPWTDAAAERDRRGGEEQAARRAARRRSPRCIRAGSRRTGRCLRRLVFAPNFGTVQFEQTPASPDVVHRLYTPVTAEPFARARREPLPAGRPPDPPRGVRPPHTVHRAPLKTPATDDAAGHPERGRGG